MVHFGSLLITALFRFRKAPLQGNYVQLPWVYHEPCTICSTQCKQLYSLCLQKKFQIDLAWAGFVVKTLGPQASMLSIKPTLQTQTLDS